jgi:hypothetical protein
MRKREPSNSNQEKKQNQQTQEGSPTNRTCTTHKQNQELFDLHGRTKERKMLQLTRIAVTFLLLGTVVSRLGDHEDLKTIQTSTNTSFGDADSYIITAGGAVAVAANSVVVGNIISTGAFSAAAASKLTGNIDCVGAVAVGADATLKGISLSPFLTPSLILILSCQAASLLKEDLLLVLHRK